MSAKLVTEAGFYNGRFLKAGQHYESDSHDDDVGDVEISDKLPKDALLAIAAQRGVQVEASQTKAEIIAAIEAAGAN